MEHRVRDPDTLGSLLQPLCKDRAIVRDHSGKFVYNASKLVSAHPETTFLDVILRSKATKNPIVSVAAEILRSAQNDIREFPDRHSNWKEHYSTTWEKWMKPEHRKPKPEWLRRRFSFKSSVTEVNDLLQDLNLHTVCQEAHCPNQSECFGNHTATLMLLGDHCSRNCTFCAVNHGVLEPPDPDEPQRVAAAVSRLELGYVVLTSVTRDDLADGGGSHFAATIKAIRSVGPDVLVEVLIPDFQGSVQALATVLDARPSVLNHNIETVSRLYPKVRPQADYQRSLQLLAEVSSLNPNTVTKSGFMVGFGERPEEVSGLMQDLRRVDCDLVTIGQYLRPSQDHYPLVDYIHPELFKAYQREAESLGFLGVAAGPYVRSSYQAELLYQEAMREKNDLNR